MREPGLARHLAAAATGDRPAAAWRGSRRAFLSSVLLAPALFAGFGAGAVRADVPETIARIKGSVVVVGTFQRLRSPAFVFRGTGFAVGDGSIVATNAHVLRPPVEADKDEALVVLLPGANRPDAVRRVRELAVNDSRDLAVVKMEGPPIAPLALAAEDSVREGEQLLFTGYPIGNVLGAYPVTHRAMVASIPPIAIPAPNASTLNPAVARRIASGTFPIYQLDATAYPGNSGSPVYDPASGRVVGVINMVLIRSTRESALSQPTGISYAIPVVHLRELLERAR